MTPDHSFWSHLFREHKRGTRTASLWRVQTTTCCCSQTSFCAAVQQIQNQWPWLWFWDSFWPHLSGTVRNTPQVCLQAVFCIPQYAQLGLLSQWQAILFALSLISPSKELLLMCRKKGWMFLPATVLLQIQGCTQDWSHWTLQQLKTSHTRGYPALPFYPSLFAE